MAGVQTHTNEFWPEPMVFERTSTVFGFQDTSLVKKPLSLEMVTFWLVVEPVEFSFSILVVRSSVVVLSPVVVVRRSL